MKTDFDFEDDRPTWTSPPPSGVARELDEPTRRKLRKLARACREFHCYSVAWKLEEKANG